MARIGCSSVGKMIHIWITSEKGSRREFRASPLQARAFIKMLENSIEETEVGGFPRSRGTSVKEDCA